MFRSLRLGKAFGIPLYLHWSFFLLPAWVAWQQWGEGPGAVLFGLTALGAVFGCVLLHELGHALMARYFGYGTRDITLYPIGGVARLESTGEKPDQELCIALAGPAVNLVLFLLLTPFFLLAAFSGLLTPSTGPEPGLLALAARFVLWLWVANGGLLVFNLVPAFPMDGGRVLRALLQTGLSRVRATEVAATVSVIIAIPVGVLALFSSHPFLAAIALFVCFAGQQELYVLRRLEARRRAESQPAVFQVFGPELPGAEARPAPTRFTGFAWDPEQRIWVRWVDGQPVQAYR
jgi:Zn-dependent protease